MNKYEKLRAKKNQALEGAKQDISNMQTVASESYRVANVAANAQNIMNDIDKKFASVTKLDSVDVKFLFFATALQCIRQYWLTNDSLRVGDQEASKFVKKYVPISLAGPVPYDAFKKEGFIGNTGISGANHRYTTLGHDPLLGWIFGTANILTDTVTKNNFLLESYNTVLVGNEYKICEATNIGHIFLESVDRVQKDYKDLILAVMKHAVHLASDAFTTMGLPIPIINSLSPDLSSKLLKNGIDVYSVTRGIAVSSFINMLITAIHGLFYNPAQYSSREIYEVKTRKILSYSNSIASASNVIYVAISASLGNESALKQLDVGGILVTIYRLITDTKFINQVKEEFLEKEFHTIVMGTDYDF